jgi:putative alpha-1,2-mannosidase
VFCSNHFHPAYAELMKGGTLNLTMSEQPNKNKGIPKEDAPYSFSNEK